MRRCGRDARTTAGRRAHDAYQPRDRAHGADKGFGTTVSSLSFYHKISHITNIYEGHRLLILL